MHKEKIAVIGSGISGLSSSLFLSKKYDVQLFEKNDDLGGHTRTKTVSVNNYKYDIDTGFIVFNNKNYPDLVNFFKYLEVETLNSNMSFSVSINKPEIEYAGSNLNSIFAQRKNIFSMNFLFLLYEIFIFYKKCKQISKNEVIENMTLEEFLSQNNYSNDIKNFHIYPIVSSIWSTNKNDIKNFPLISFLNFFDNHGLFNFIDRPQWKFIKGGSKKYIKALINKKLFKIKTKTKIKKIIRNNNEIILISENNEKFITSKVVLATHGDQALQIIDDPTQKELLILSQFKYSKNKAYLHSDERLMPKRKTAWSSWNFLSNNTVEKSFSLTYWMNLLQNLPNRKNFFVSINPYILPNNYYDEVIFEHPIINTAVLDAQKKLNTIQGIKNTWYCGSYCGYGFHEDGIQSAAYIAKLHNTILPWERKSQFYNRLLYTN